MQESMHVWESGQWKYPASRRGSIYERERDSQVTRRTPWRSVVQPFVVIILITF